LPKASEKGILEKIKRKRRHGKGDLPYLVMLVKGLDNRTKRYLESEGVDSCLPYPGCFVGPPEEKSVLVRIIEKYLK
jgi:hypothetical protein